LWIVTGKAGQHSSGFIAEPQTTATTAATISACCQPAATAAATNACNAERERKRTK